VDFPTVRILRDITIRCVNIDLPVLSKSWLSIDGKVTEKWLPVLTGMAELHSDVS